MGKKRTNDGKEKLQKTASTNWRQQQQPEHVNGLPKTPPGAQVPSPSTPITTMTANPQPKEDDEPIAKKQKQNSTANPHENTTALQQRPAKSQAPPKHEKRQKLTPLPDHVILTKRPIYHPTLPSPFASSSQPKIIYLTATSPFIPAIKRIRNLLAEITKRHKQSLSAHQHPRSRQKPRSKPVEANGKLKAANLEREIAEDVAEKDGLGAEQVYVKATGRAIERALQVGVHFQGENDCTVRVEMGSVQAIDDISIKRKKDQGVGEDVDMNTTGETDNGNGKQGKKGKKGKMWVDEDIPETRTRTLSSITVAIGLT